MVSAGPLKNWGGPTSGSEDKCWSLADGHWDQVTGVTKLGRTFRSATEEHAQQERARVRKDQLEKLRQLLEVGGHEAESDYVQLLKDWKPEITKEELQKRIRQFHAAVSERQLRDRESR